LTYYPSLITPLIILPNAMNVPSCSLLYSLAI